MLFNSYIFVLVFLPLSILGYFFLNKINKVTWAQCFLLGMSLWFYGYFNVKYLFIIVASILFNYIMYRFLTRDIDNKIRKGILIIAVLFNVGVLFVFKYYNFFMETVNSIFNTEFSLHQLVLPLGISFFTFQQLSFIVDSYTNDMPKYSFLSYALFVTFFPQLIAGPIVTHNELIPQFEDKARQKLDWRHVSEGLYAFTLGLAKKVLIADTFGNAANWGFGNLAELDTISAVVCMLSYTIQIYFDFSGYSDMALGIARMINIDLPINFNSPYKALTITEFWDRWHITLTRFFTKYIYIPLGGNKRGNIRTYINMMIVFLISGLWHGANWTFVIWGGMHGLFMVITRWKKKVFEKLHPVFNWMLTFIFVNFTWIIFRADSVKDALEYMQRIFALQFNGLNENILQCFQLPELVWLFDKLHFSIWYRFPYFFMVVFFLFSFICILGMKNTYERIINFKASFGKSLWTAILLIWCIFSFAGISTFLYFNF